jgi:hypothetical protein
MDRCEIVLSRNLGDADGEPCSRSAVAVCSDCESEMCDLHAEECELCGQEFCSMCLLIHSNEPHAKRPAGESKEPVSPKKRFA